MDDAAIKKAIELFGNARLKHTFLGGDVPPELHPQTVAEGYAIQEGVVDYLIANGFGTRDEIGIKIGLTSKENREIWGGEAHLGANHPTMNFIWKMYHEHADLKWDDYHQLFVECEFGVRMGRDCPASDAPYTQESIAEYIDVCMAGIELVDPSVDYRQTPAPMIPLALADNAANSGGVFGKGTTEWRDLDIPNIKGTMVIDGEEMETGPSSRLDGHPFNTLSWGANHLVERGNPIRAGQCLILGSVTATYPLPRGSTAVMTFEHLGQVSCSIT